MAMANEEEVPGHKYVLHFNPYSVCSLMVLFTLRLKGSPKTPRDEVEVEIRLVDIFHEEQLSEHFLCDVTKRARYLLSSRLDLAWPLKTHSRYRY